MSACSPSPPVESRVRETGSLIFPKLIFIIEFVLDPSFSFMQGIGLGLLPHPQHSELNPIRIPVMGEHPTVLALEYLVHDRTVCRGPRCMPDTDRIPRHTRPTIIILFGGDALPCSPPGRFPTHGNLGAIVVFPGKIFVNSEGLLSIVFLIHNA